MNSIVRGGEFGGSKYLTSTFFEKIVENKKIFYFLVHQKMIQMIFLLCRCALKIKTTYGEDIGVVKKKYLIYI